MKTCIVCSKEFEAARSTAKFCSAACKMKYARGGVPAPKESPQGVVVDEPPSLDAESLPPPNVLHVKKPGKDDLKVASPGEGASREERDLMVSIIDHYMAKGGYAH